MSLIFLQMKKTIIHPCGSTIPKPIPKFPKYTKPFYFLKAHCISYLKNYLGFLQSSPVWNNHKFVMMPVSWDMVLSRVLLNPVLVKNPSFQFSFSLFRMCSQIMISFKFQLLNEQIVCFPVYQLNKLLQFVLWSYKLCCPWFKVDKVKTKGGDWRKQGKKILVSFVLYRAVHGELYVSLVHLLKHQLITKRIISGIWSLQ